MQPTRHSIRLHNSIGADGTHEIVFYDWGNVDAAKVTICVHGLTRNAHDFDVIAQYLAGSGRRVFSISMAGRGESEWLADPAGYNYASYVADCIAILDNFHMREVEWLGTSMGGIIGMMIAAQHPSRIRKLIMNDIGALLTKPALTRIYDYVRTMPTQFANRTEADAYLRTAFAPFNITDAKLWEQFVDASLITRDGQLRYTCDPAIAVPLSAATENFTKIEDVNLSPIWAEIQTPTLILHGAESDILSADTIRAMRSTNINTESITFEGVGHAPALMTEAQIHPILRWLDRTTVSMMATSF